MLAIASFCSKCEFWLPVLGAIFEFSYALVLSPRHLEQQAGCHDPGRSKRFISDDLCQCLTFRCLVWCQVSDSKAECGLTLAADAASGAKYLLRKHVLEFGASRLESIQGAAIYSAVDSVVLMQDYVRSGHRQRLGKRSKGMQGSGRRPGEAFSV
jgi:hypothetical protein